MEVHPLLILAIGIATVIGMIVVLRLNAFISLITAAIIVSILSPGDWADKIGRVASSFGSTAGSIGIVIALAAVIGKCMMDSGSADRVVRMFMSLLGEKRGALALNASGYVLAVPVFFDTVFYLLVPLARSMYRRTKKNYLMYIMAIGAGGAITHTLVPPTPGPLVMADTLGVDLGVMILVGALVALPCALLGLGYASWIDRKMPVEMRSLGGSLPEPEPMHDDEMPPLLLALAPVVLPVLLISINTGLSTWADGEHAALLREGQVKDWPALRTAIYQQHSEDETARASLTPDEAAKKPYTPHTPGGRIVARLPKEMAALLASNDPITDAQRSALRDAINRQVLGSRSLYDRKTFQTYPLSSDADRLAGKDRARMSVADLERLNRLLLEAAYPGQIEPHTWQTDRRKAANWGSLFCNPNLALLFSAGIAILVYVWKRKPTRDEFVHSIENALMSAGVIILITAAGGAFGGMLEKAEIKEAIEKMFASDGKAVAGFMLLILGFVIAAILKVAQGSSTVAMITASSMLAAMVGAPEKLPFHPVYLATAIGSGSLVCSWMNDSGFWIVAKMGGLTEIEALKSWTIMLVALGICGMIFTCILAGVLPLHGVGG